MKQQSDITINLPHLELAGRYRLQARRPDGSIRLDTGWIDNLITDAGLNAIGESLALTGWCVVGTGNAVPNVADAQLQTPLAVVGGGASSRGIVTSTPRYGWEQRQYVFPQGAVVGNISEVGVGWTNSTTTPVFSRSLVTPTQSIIALDQLTVIYEIRMYVPAFDGSGDVTGTVTIATVDYDYTIRPINIESNGAAGSQPLGKGWGPNLLTRDGAVRQWQIPFVNTWPAVAYRAPTVLTPATNSVLWSSTGVNQGSSASATDSGNTNAAYVTNSLQCNFTSCWPPSVANWAEGIQGFTFSGIAGTYQCILDAAIPKNNTQELKMNWRQTWARHV